jgi:chromosome segregation ATPase
MNPNIEKLLESINSTLSALDKKETSEANVKQIREVIESKISEWGEKWNKEKTEKEEALAKAENRILELENSTKEAGSKVETLEKELKKITEAAIAQQQEADFQSRMNSLASDFDFSDEERKLIAKKIKGMDDDKYTEWYNEFTVFASAKKKENIKASDELQTKISELEAKLKEKELSTASAVNNQSDTEDAPNAEGILDNVVENVNQSIANTQSPSTKEPTLLDQFAEGFKGSIKIKY